MWRAVVRASLLCPRVLQSVCRPVRLPVLPPPGQQLYMSRGYSHHKDEPYPRLVITVTLLDLLRNKFYLFLIRTYLDQDFTYEEFNRGARHAFLSVSRLLSQCKFDALEKLVAKEILEDLQVKYSKLSDDCRKAMTADSDEKLGSRPGHVVIHYDDNGRKFVNILVHFWYVKNVDFLDDELKETKVYQVESGNRPAEVKQRIFTTYFEFRREFTEGIKPNWIITRIDLPKYVT